MHQLENLNCGGVEEFCTNYQTGDTSESFIYRKGTKLTINLKKSFYSTVAFSGEQNLKRDYSLFLKKTGEVSYFILFVVKKKAPMYKLVKSPI